MKTNKILLIVLFLLTLSCFPFKTFGAVAFRSYSTTEGTCGTDVTGTEPSGATQSDILIAWLNIESSGAVTPPSGWSNVFAGTTMLDDVTASNQDTHLYAYWIRRGASAPSYFWDWAGSPCYSLLISAYSGAKTTGDPFSFGTGATKGTNTNRLFPDISGTTLKTNEMLIWLGGRESTTPTSSTQPTGFTERLDIGGLTNWGFTFADKLQTNAGSTGTVTGASWSGGDTNDAGTFLVGLMPHSPTLVKARGRVSVRGGAKFR